ncbi:MAG: thiol peroxidase, partial [Muribaculaceae bacterium]|nr:thiol peroxidase [Muribaculaceae bacterium]
METIYFQGTPCHTYGNVPAVGEKAPCFNLVNKDLKEISCIDFRGKRVVLNVFPSLDTPVCAASVRRFNLEASGLDDTVVICVSMDLPFAASRFCTAEGIANLEVASAFRSPLFAQKYGLQIVDGPLAGLLARAVII